jgi:Domain of Unknown Function with PDB structure (DUF3857)/Transglutaminase-like superfamily
MLHRRALAIQGIFLLSIFIAALSFAAADPPGEKPTPTPLTRLDDVTASEDYANADHVIVFEEAINKVKPSGVTYVDGYRLLKVLTPAGCRDQSVLKWQYDPQSSHIEVLEVNIIRDGERIPVDVTKVHDLPAPQAAIYWSDRIKTLQLPRLVVDDGIEIITFRKGFTYALLEQGGASGGAGGSTAPDDDRYIPPMPGEYFDIVLFAENVPIMEKRYVLRLPADKRLHAEVYNGALYSSVTYTEEHSEYAWWCLDMPARPHEARQPDASDFSPKVVMATAESWEAKSRWFFDVNKNQFEVTSAIQEKVDQILDEANLTKASDEKKAKALVHWVAQNIRYSGQTMGEGEGFTLHPSDMIFEQRSGVCKDIAGMLVTMMRAADLDSYAAMTMAGSRIDEVPADQFNHCVVALKKDDGNYEMYDPTWVPYNNAIWSYSETEQHYVVGSPEGETLSRIRYSPPSESPLNVEHKAELAENGDLKGTFKIEGTGAMDGRLRRLVSGTRRGELDQRCARLLSPVSNRIESVKCKAMDPENFDQNMWIEFEYTIKRFAQKVAGSWEFTSPLMQVVLHDGSFFSNGQTDWADERETDLLLWYTQQINGNETIRLPKGFKLSDPPAPDEVDETYGSFTGAVQQDGRDLIITEKAEVRRRQIPPDGYPGFKKAMNAAQSWGEQIFRVTKEGK